MPCQLKAAQQLAACQLGPECVRGVVGGWGTRQCRANGDTVRGRAGDGIRNLAENARRSFAQSLQLAHHRQGHSWPPSSTMRPAAQMHYCPECWLGCVSRRGVNRHRDTCHRGPLQTCHRCRLPVQAASFATHSRGCRGTTHFTSTAQAHASAAGGNAARAAAAASTSAAPRPAALAVPHAGGHSARATQPTRAAVDTVTTVQPDSVVMSHAPTHDPCPVTPGLAPEGEAAGRWKSRAGSFANAHSAGMFKHALLPTAATKAMWLNLATNGAAQRLPCSPDWPRSTHYRGRLRCASVPAAGHAAAFVAALQRSLLDAASGKRAGSARRVPARRHQVA